MGNRRIGWHTNVTEQVIKSVNQINTMSYPIIFNSNPIELTAHTSCYCLELTLYIPKKVMMCYWHHKTTDFITKHERNVGRRQQTNLIYSIPLISLISLIWCPRYPRYPRVCSTHTVFLSVCLSVCMSAVCLSAVCLSAVCLLKIVISRVP